MNEQTYKVLEQLIISLFSVIPPAFLGSLGHNNSINKKKVNFDKDQRTFDIMDNMKSIIKYFLICVSIAFISHFILVFGNRYMKNILAYISLYTIYTIIFISYNFMSRKTDSSLKKKNISYKLQGILVLVLMRENKRKHLEVQCLLISIPLTMTYEFYVGTIFTKSIGVFIINLLIFIVFFVINLELYLEYANSYYDEYKYRLVFMNGKRINCTELYEDKTSYFIVEYWSNITKNKNIIEVKKSDIASLSIGISRYYVSDLKKEKNKIML